MGGVATGSIKAYEADTVAPIMKKRGLTPSSTPWGRTQGEGEEEGGNVREME